MVTRIGHIALHVADLDAAVDFQQQVIGMVETERTGGASLPDLQRPPPRADPRSRTARTAATSTSRSRSRTPRVLERRGAAADRRRRHAARRHLRRRARHRPRAEGASPGGHVYKLFCGMETVDAPPPGDRPVKFEHLSCKVAQPPRRGALPHRRPRLPLLATAWASVASWWHCDEDHHGIALTRAPRAELSHYAYQWSDFAALGRVADRLQGRARPQVHLGPEPPRPRQQPLPLPPRRGRRDGRVLLGDSRRCSATATSRRTGALASAPINQWGGPPPLRFLLTGFPIADAAARPPAVGDAPRPHARGRLSPFTNHGAMTCDQR